MIISIDLGSNTLRVSKIDSNLNRVKEYQKVVKTAQNLSKNNNKISKKTVKRVLKSLKESKKIVQYSSKNSHIVAVTTEAIRVTKNQKKVIKKIYKNSGIKFKVISGKKEAYITSLAIKYRLKKIGISGKIASIDLGGASTEIVLPNEKSKSFPIGILKIYNKYKSMKKINKHLKKELKDIEKFVKSVDIEYLVSTAGTATTLSAIKNDLNYKNYNYKIINGSKITLKDSKKYFKYLKKLNKKNRKELIGKSRYKLIRTGLLIIKHLFKIFRKKSSFVIDDGLREGIAIEYFNKKSKNIRVFNV